MSANTIWILGTIARALKSATAQGLTVQSMRLNPVDYKLICESIETNRVESYGSLAGVLFISDAGISIGYVRLECVKLPGGLEFAKQVDALESAMGGDIKTRKPPVKSERSN